jgi:hypothetical protein
VRVHLAREHALELEVLDGALDRGRVSLQFRETGRVILDLDEIEQLVHVLQAAGDAVQAADGGVEPGALAAEILCAFRSVPDLRILELAIDFFETLTLGGVLKDTP